jgi:hypothetical protein
LEADGEVDAPAEVHAPVVATPANPDDEFLRRVVLPTPVPTITRPAGALPFEPMSLAESQDRTVISEPPSPEILAAMSAPVPVAAPVPALSASGAHPGLPLGWQDSGYSRPARRWQLSSMQLGGLLLAAAIGGAFIGGTLRPGTATEPALEAAAVAPLIPAAVVPTITPIGKSGTTAAIPTTTGQTVPAAMPTTSGPDIQPITRPVSVSKRTTSPIRRSASKRAPKKEFVDPFE